MRIKEFDVKKEAKKLDRKYSGKQRLIFSGIVLLLLTILLYTSYAIFIASDKDIITNTEVGPFSTGDVKIAVYVDGAKQSSFPPSTSGKEYEKTECVQGSSAVWDESRWEINIKANKQDSCSVYFVTSNTLKTKLLVAGGGANVIRNKYANFNQHPVTDNGMYAAEDNWGMSYYYRGNVTNNNVTFAGKNWKIIRINGNESIRMVLAQNIGTSVFNTSNNRNGFVGLWYGPGGSTWEAEHNHQSPGGNYSPITTMLTNWYNTNITGSNRDKVADDYEDDYLFCADKTVAHAGFPAGNTGLGYGTNVTYYSAYQRIVVKNSQL